MNAIPVHFAIHTDDIDRASAFYKAVFDWGFQPYGPPGFLQIKSAEGEEGQLIGALQDRSFNAAPDKVIGFETTMLVADVAAVAARVAASGGTLLMPKTEIPHVGWIIKFLDTEGNLCCAMERG